MLRTIKVINVNSGNIFPTGTIFGDLRIIVKDPDSAGFVSTYLSIDIPLPEDSTQFDFPFNLAVEVTAQRLDSNKNPIGAKISTGWFETETLVSGPIPYGISIV